MRLEAGSKVFVLRYNENYIVDAMRIHSEKCKENGNCWYGKAGKKPNMSKLKEFMGNGINMIFYNKNKTYVCKLIDVSEDKPSCGYPDCYNNSMWSPNSWYLVTELMGVEKDILNKLVVLSTGKKMSDTINSSMTSFYFTKTIDTIVLKGETDA